MKCLAVVALALVFAVGCGKAQKPQEAPQTASVDIERVKADARAEGWAAGYAEGRAVTPKPKQAAGLPAVSSEEPIEGTAEAMAKLIKDNRARFDALHAEGARVILSGELQEVNRSSSTSRYILHFTAPGSHATTTGGSRLDLACYFETADEIQKLRKGDSIKVLGQVFREPRGNEIKLIYCSLVK